LISIIIILYNSKKYITKCIDSIEKNFSEKKDYEIILFNNSSDYYKDNSIKSYKIINSKDNIGYSKALNYCISISKGNYILSLNPDTILYSDSISNLKNTFNYYQDVGVVGAKILNVDMSFQLSSRRAFPTTSTILIKYFNKIKLTKKNPYNYIDIEKNKIYEVDAVSGCCMMFKKSIYDKLNGFDERFFLYFEDTDFCYRMKGNQYKVIYNPNSKIIHYKGASSNYKNKIFVLFNFYMSMFKFILKYYKKYKIVLLFCFISLIIIFK